MYDLFFNFLKTYCFKLNEQNILYFTASKLLHLNLKIWSCFNIEYRICSLIKMLHAVVTENVDYVYF